MTNNNPAAIRALQSRIGEVLRVTPWRCITQEECDTFAKLADDEDPMHNDPEWAAQTHWGGTIVQAAHVLSIATGLLGDKDFPLDVQSDGNVYVLNYGYDRVRVIAPLRVGHDFRFIIKLVDIRPKSEKEFVLKLDMTVEVKDRDTPFMVIESLVYWATDQGMPKVA